MFLPRINALSYCIVSTKDKCRTPMSIELPDINLGNNTEYNSKSSFVSWCVLRFLKIKYDFNSRWIRFQERNAIKYALKESAIQLHSFKWSYWHHLKIWYTIYDGNVLGTISILHQYKLELENKSDIIKNKELF